MIGDPVTINEEYSLLLQFFKWAMQVSFDGNDIDGSDMQRMAVSLRLAKFEPYDPVRHGLSTHCEEGDQWCRINAGLQQEGFERVGRALNTAQKRTK